MTRRWKMTTKAQDTTEAESKESVKETEEQATDKSAEETIYEEKKTEEEEKPETDEKKSEEEKSDEAEKSDEKKEEKQEKQEEKKEDEKVEVTKADLKISKKSNLTDENVDEIVKFVNEQGLSKEQAQAQLDRESQVRSQIQEGLQKQLDEKVDEWTETSEKDKEFGGDKLKETQTRCNALLKKHFSEEFVKTLIDTGYANHPELIRGLNRIAKTMDPDQLIISSAKTEDNSQKPAEDILYGDSDKK